MATSIHDSSFLCPREAPSVPTHPQKAKTKHQGRTLMALNAIVGKAELGFSWWWWWEIFAAIISLFGVLLIVALLFKIDKTPLNSWLLPIQPNSLLSVLTTASKTFLLVPVTSCISQLKWRHFSLGPRPLNQLQLFDDASRGPWGSAVMMFKLIFQGRLWATVAFGLAFSNIFALGIDPSAQQIISFRVKEMKSASNQVLASRAGAYFSRTWDAGNPDVNYSKVFPGLELLSEADRSREAFRLKTTIFNAMAHNASQPFYTCPEPALRCTWDDFSTLGICAKLRNVTDSVKQTCTFVDVGRNTNVWRNGTCNFWYDSLTSVTWNEYLPVDPISLTYLITVPDLNVRSGGQGGVFHNILVNSTSSVGSMWMVRIKNFTDSFDGRSYTKFESYVSDFYWCHRALHDVTASSHGLMVRSIASTPWADMDGTLSYKNMFYEEVGWTKESSIPYNNPLMGEVTYHISAAAFNAISQIPLSLIGTKLFWDLYGRVTEIRERYGSFNTEVQVARFLLTNDVEAFTQTLADALTAYVVEPNSDNINATTITGYMVYNETYFQVQWPWISVLIFELFLGITFLATTIFLSRGQPLLKSSAIALLIHTLSGWSHADLRVPTQESPEKWEEIAEGMVAQLSKDENGLLRFKRIVLTE
ncbi:hypothetical protein HD806DRAFT_552157 [Xylariaceae sp. AK1471]|nr:hypothetical protein HD806DRAFT_552157 [Xylariaceae sp. AK1471]